MNVQESMGAEASALIESQSLLVPSQLEAIQSKVHVGGGEVSATTRDDAAGDAAGDAADDGLVIVRRGHIHVIHGEESEGSSTQKSGEQTDVDLKSHILPYTGWGIQCL